MGEEDTSTDSLVYHYTSAQGFLGIIDNPLAKFGPPPEWLINRERLVVLQGSDVRYMNDARELRVIGEKVADGLLEAVGSFEEPDVQFAMSEVADSLRTPGRPFGGSHRVFAVCFCSRGDLLSQWRGYAGTRGGYAIGFEKSMLEYATFVQLGPWPSFPSPARVGATFAGVVYVDKTHDAEQDFTDIIKEQVVKAVELRRFQLDPERRADFPPLWGWMSGFARYKDEAFSEEQEWRLIHEAAVVAGGPQSAPADFRARSDGLVPYTSFVVGSPMADEPRLRKIDMTRVIADVVVGPGPDMDLRVDAARAVLEKNGHRPEVVRPSSVPFKG